MRGTGTTSPAEAFPEEILYGSIHREGPPPASMPELPTAPKRATIQDLSEIPTQVIDTFNDLLLEKYTGGSVSAIISLDELTERLQPLGIEVEQALDWGWMDIDRLYVRRGWHVEYGVFEADDHHVVAGMSSMVSSRPMIIIWSAGSSAIPSIVELIK